MKLACCVLLLLGVCTCSAFQFQRSYRGSTTLHHNRAGKTYTVHWDVDISKQKIYFAVNASTTGWVGLGISPDGGMPHSDVVIGWISRDGELHFKVSTALVKICMHAPWLWKLHHVYMYM